MMQLSMTLLFSRQDIFTICYLNIKAKCFSALIDFYDDIYV